MEILTIEEIKKDELDIGHVPCENRTKIENMVRKYEPMKCKNSNVAMKIILKDENPIYCSPRRLPYHEKK